MEGVPGGALRIFYSRNKRTQLNHMQNNPRRMNPHGAIAMRNSDRLN
jgi:hypothetical protein